MVAYRPNRHRMPPNIKYRVKSPSKVPGLEQSQFNRGEFLGHLNKNGFCHRVAWGPPEVNCVGAQCFGYYSLLDANRKSYRLNSETLLRKIL